MIKDRERTSLMVTLLDRDKATAFVRNRFDNDRLVAEPMVVVNGKKGLATVCTEGVGWVKDEDGLYTLLFDDINSFGMWVDITEDELFSLMSDEQTDLATFIRVFGDRLETNFDIWYSRGRDCSQDLAVV